MDEKKQIVPPRLNKESNSISDRIKRTKENNRLMVNFEKFNLTPICIRGRFNNYFKNTQHFSDIAADFLGKILPKITSHTYKEICEGSQEGRVLHFHTIDKKHQELVCDVLKEYGFSQQTIEQMSEGNDLFDFSATLGHIHAARVVCHKVDNILYFLFLDTNHHIYMNEKYVKESLFYEDCPLYSDDSCNYMPMDCFAVSYLDEQKFRETMGYVVTPV